MGDTNYLSAEFKRLFYKKSVLISVLVVLLVPLIYAMIMLSPKWGPQDNIDNLPIAVVNNDQGAGNEGEIVNIGEELVGNLEANPTLGWDFVSSEEADKGMDDMEYYMVIEVPEDFSKRALTVLDDNPERPELKFSQNEGLHYMAAQVTDSAIDTIKNQLSTQITETYVQTVVDKLGGVADGFSEAADGAEQINDGSNELKDGSDLMLSSLTEKSGDINRLADGSQELNAGTNELLTNLTGKSADILKLANGANELSAGAGELKAGTDDLKTGTSELKAGAGELQAGTNELKAGTGDLKAGTNDLKAGTDDLKAGSSQLKAGSSELSQGTQDLKAGSTELKAGAAEASAGSDELLDALDVNDGRVGAGITELAAGTETARSGVIESIESLKMLQMGLESLANTPEDDDAYDELIQGINALTAVLASSIEEAEQEKIPDLDRLVAGGEELRAGLADADGEFKSGLIRLNNGLGELSAGAQELDAGATQLVDGTNELKAGAAELDAGAGQLTAGAAELDAGAGQLNAGANELSAGTNELSSGVGELVAGANELNAGAGELSAGAVQVADGNQTVKAGWAQLEAGATQLHDGSTQIKDGNSQVKDGWTELTDGTTQIDDGLLQVVDGSAELHEGLTGGAEEASALDPQDENIAMFAEPVVLDGEVINSFPFYRDANAPYIITLALFVGILAMSFVVPYRKPAILPPSAISWYAGKIANLTLLAVAQALIISLYSLFILKIEVHSGLQFVLFSVWVSLTFLMIVLFLVVLAGNIGRFAALAFAVIQLSTTGSELPIHMLPEGLRSLSVFLPFTYSIDGFKNIITLGSTSSVWANIGVLFIYFATFALLSGIVFFIRYRRLNREEFAEEDGTETAL